MSGLGIICAEKPQICELCGTHEECRPYGPNKEQICFKCGSKDEITTMARTLEYVYGVPYEEAREMANKNYPIKQLTTH